MGEVPLRKLYPYFIALGLLVSGLVIIAFYKDQFREWKTWQGLYKKQELTRATNESQREAARRIPIAIKQIVLPDLHRVDRCVTCHVTVEDASYAGFAQPLAYHPNHAQHPFEKFACTICHQGQGLATTREAAHGNVKHWEHPMLPMKYIESACAKCHLPSDVPGAPKLARGREVFEERGCIGCHKLNGSGGAIGPELDAVGSHRSPEWLAKHFRNPAVVTPGSPMPPVIVNEDDLDALTMYMLSLTGEPLSAYYVSMRTIPNIDTGKRLFQENCIGCHSLGGVGGKVGPALDEVGTRRNAEWIATHFRNPQSLSPESVMPKFNFTENEIRALTTFLLSKSDSSVVGFLKVPALMTPAERGKLIFRKYGCAGCHGLEGAGGVTNRNAKTAEQVPGLKFVGDSYTKEEVKKLIMSGRRDIVPMDPKQPTPPLYMPSWRGKIAEGELDDLVEYLMSLLPKSAKKDEF